MADICVNINSPEYKELAKTSNIGQRDLKAIIATWQHYNGVDNYPTLDQVKAYQRGDVELPLNFTEEVSKQKTVHFLENTVPWISISVINDAIQNMVNNKRNSDINNIKMSFDTLWNGDISQMNAVSNFIYLWDTFTSPKEKSNIFSKFDTKDGNRQKDFNNMWMELAEIWFDSENPNYKIKDEDIAKIIGRIGSVGMVMRKLPSVFSNYSKLFKSTNTNEWVRRKATKEEKFENDMRVYNTPALRWFKVKFDPTNDYSMRDAIEATDAAYATLLKNIQNEDLAFKNLNVSTGEAKVWMRKPKIEQYSDVYPSVSQSNENMESLEKRREYYFGDKDTITAKELVEKIIANSSSPLLAKALLPYIDEDTVVKIDSGYTLNAEDYNITTLKEASGVYIRPTNTIVLSMSGLTHSTMLHEIIHSLSNIYLSSNKDTQLVRDFTRLYEHVKKELKGEDWYGLTDIDEFMTALFTDTAFIERIKSIPAIEANKYKNVFVELFNKILEFFSIKRGSSIYEQSFAVATNVIASQHEYLTSFKEIHGERMPINLRNLNETFSYPSTVKAINTPMVDANKTLSGIYTLQEIKDVTKTVTSIFVDTIDYYQQQNPQLDRKEVINSITPARLFKEVKEEIEWILGDMTNRKVSPLYINNIQKLLDNYNDVLLLSLGEISFMEGLKFKISGLQAYDINISQELDNGVNPLGEMGDDASFKEESILEGWQKNYLHTSVGDGLTPSVKKALSSIQELDKHGNPVVNSLGFGRALDLEVIKNDLLRRTQSLSSGKDLIPLLEKLSKEKPYIKSLLKRIQEDDVLFSQFYHVMRRDHTNMGVVITNEMPDGSIEYKSTIINKRANQSLFIEDWKNIIENNSIKNNKYSIYDSNGKLLVKNINNNITILKTLLKDWTAIVQQNDVAKRKKFIGDKSITIKNQLDAVGIDISKVDLKNMFDDAFVEDSTRINFNINTVFNSLIGINTWASANVSNPNISTLDIVVNNSKNYNGIASIAAGTLQELIEGSVNELGKGYYTYLLPSYLSTFVKKMKNTSGNKAEFEAFIQKEFKQYEGTLYDPVSNSYNISWLNKLTDRSQGAKKRELFDYKMVLHFNRTEYADMTDTQYANLLLTEYFKHSSTSDGNDNPFAWYHSPIFSDSPVAGFYKFDRIINNFKDNISRDLLGVFQQEWNTIKITKEREERVKKGDILGIENIDGKWENKEWIEGNGSKFNFLSFLNDSMSDIEFILSNAYPGTPQQAMKEIQNLIQKGLDVKADASIKKLNDLGLLELTKNNSFKYLADLGITPGNMENKLHEFFYNSFLASTNIIQITNTNLGYFKNTEDFQKRNKQVYAPGNSVNVDAEYNGVRIGTDDERYVVFKDVFEGSSKEFIDNLTEALKESHLSPVERDIIISSYYSHNLTDAQAIRSLKSVKKVIAMSKGWSQKLEDSYQRLNNGNWSLEDFTIMHQAFKPFVYTQQSVNSGTVINGKEVPIKVPTQHKNSEFFLIPSMVKQFKSPKLRGLLDVLNDEDMNLDVVMFDSAVKEGNMGVLDISEITTAKGIHDHVKNFIHNPNVIRSIPYDDYRLQQVVPEHIMDSYGGVGSQLRRLAVSDISNNPAWRIEIGGKSLTKKEFLQLYDNTIIENVLNSFINVKGEFEDVHKLQAMIERELSNSELYSKDLLNACQIASDGKFVLPPFEPSQSNRIQQLLNSVWKNNITKQKIKGGKAVQVSSYGLSNQLEIKWKEVNGQKAIDYISAYLPFHSSKMPHNWENTFIDPNTGIMDVNKMLDAGLIDENMLEMIGYRVPTEGKYSMLPIKVIGFLPRYVGGNIILPREITTILGSDFDVDSIYLMFKEFNFNTIYDIKKAFKDFYESHGELYEQYKSEKDKEKAIREYEKEVANMPSYFFEESVTKTNKEVKKELGITDAFSKWFNLHKNTYILTQKFETVHYDINKDVSLMDEKERNNLFIDMVRGMLTHPDSISSQLNPGNFDKLKATSKRIQLVETTNQSWKDISKMSLSELKKTAKNDNLDMLDYTTQIYLQNQNMVAARLIGIAANHSVNHAIRQRTDMYINPAFNFTLNDKDYSALNLIYSPGSSKNKFLISTNYATVTAASVDAVKEPVMSSINLNTTTADAALLLVGLGHDFDSIGLFLKQPIIMDVVKHYNNSIIKGGSLQSSIIHYLELYKSILKDNGVTNESIEEYQNGLSDSFMADQIRINRNMSNTEGIYTPGSNDYYMGQFHVLWQFSKMNDINIPLTTFIRASKADSANSGAGPKITDTIYRLRNLEKHIEYSSKEIPIIVGGESLLSKTPEYLVHDTEALRKHLRESPLGFIEAFSTLGLQFNLFVMKKMFPQASDSFKKVLNSFNSAIKSNNLNVRQMEMIINDFYAYYMSQFEYFNTKQMEEFVTTFPNDFEEMLSKHPELNDLHLIKNIKYVHAGRSTPVDKLKFLSGGKVSSRVRETIIKEWESLLFKPEYNKLAKDLFLYNYFVNGFAFGKSSFIHYAPAQLKLEIPEFRDKLYDLFDIEFSSETVNVFFHQFFRNHLEDKSFVPLIDSFDETDFVDNDGSLLEHLIISPSRNTIRNILNTEGNNISYIAVPIKGENHYYNITEMEETPTGDYSVFLSKVQPLSIRNEFIKYDYGNPSVLLDTSSFNTPINDRSEYSAEYPGNIAESYWETMRATFIKSGNTETTSTVNEEAPPVHSMYDIPLVSNETLDEKDAFNVDNINQSTKINIDTSKKINIYFTDTNGFNGLSNILNGKVTFEGKTFATVEHLYQWKKAEFAGDKATANKIFYAKTGWDAQKLGREVKNLNSKEWDKISSQELEDSMRLAFEQNQSSRDLLLSTKNALLTHKSKFNLGKWEKEFPRILMEIRRELSQNDLKNIEGFQDYSNNRAMREVTTDITVPLQFSELTQAQQERLSSKMGIFAEEEFNSQDRETQEEILKC